MGAGDDEHDELARALDDQDRLAERAFATPPLLVIRLDDPPMPSRAVGVLAAVEATGRLIGAIRPPLRAWIYQAVPDRASLIVALRHVARPLCDVWLGALTRNGALGDAPPARYAVVDRDAAPARYDFAGEDGELERWQWLELAILSSPDYLALPGGSLWRELAPAEYPALHRLLGPAAHADDLVRLGRAGLRRLGVHDAALGHLARRGLAAPDA